MAILREHVGLTVAQMASETDLTKPTIYHLEEGKSPRPLTWEKLEGRWRRELRALRLDAADFLLGRVKPATRKHIQRMTAG